MFLRRCAWHRLYHRSGKLLGIASWRGWTITFSDGLCERCASRVRADWGLPDAPPVPDERRAAWRPAFPYATAALAASIVVVLVGLVSPRSDREAAVSPPALPAPTAVQVAMGNRHEGTPATRDQFPPVVRDEFPPMARHEFPPATGDDVAPRKRGDESPSEGMGSPRHARVLTGNAARLRSRLVRVRHQGGGLVVARTRPAPVTVADARASAASADPIVLFVPATPPVVELQAP